MKTYTGPVRQSVDRLGGAELESVLASIPAKEAGMVRSGHYYVGRYRELRGHAIGQVYWRVETLLRDPYSYSGAQHWTHGREFASPNEAVAFCTTLKNIERRIQRVEATGLYIGSDESGYGCWENGYRAEVVGERRYSHKAKRWYATGILAY